jgi:hypothetical protein
MYTAKLSFVIKGQIKISHDKQKIKEPMTINPALQNILKVILNPEEEDK